MIEQITFREFRSFREATLPLAALTLLIGANASGKSNALDGLRLLSWLAAGRKLVHLRHELGRSDAPIRGRAGDLPRRGADRFGFAWQIRPSEYPEGKLEIALEGEELRIVQESLSAPGRTVPLYEVRQAALPPSNEIRVAYDNFARGGKKPLIACSDQELVMLQLQSAARFEKGHEKAAATVPKVCGEHAAALVAIRFLDPAPALMRGYASMLDAELDQRGVNLSGVLARLCEREDSRAEVLRFVESLPEQQITAVEFIETPRKDALVQLIETFGARQERFDAALLSDGTLRVLAIAAALLSAPERSVVVIEEIDNGVHPSRARMLLERIRDIAERRSLRVLLTTHNPALMDALPDPLLSAVVFCWRDPETGESKLMPLGELEDAPSLLAQGPLGRLVTAGVVDRFIKRPRKSSEERRLEAQAWIKDLFATAEE